MSVRVIYLHSATNDAGEVEWHAREDDVPGVYGVGATQEEARADLDEAIAFWERNGGARGPATQTFYVPPVEVPHV